MTHEDVINLIAEKVMRQLASAETMTDEEIPDLTSYDYRHERMNISLDPGMIATMAEKTSARICVGKSGPRIRTRTQLSLRADHAAAKDAVLKNVDPNLIRAMNLITYQTRCRDREEHLTRPDLGRQFEKTVLEELKANCKKSPAVQIYLSDGLSGEAVEVNGPQILPSLLDSLKSLKIDPGTPFFVKYGRVPLMDVISELLDAEVTCVLIGERPGLTTAESMSAYIAYRALVGMPEARRTVISNIHSEGIPAVEAGAYIADVIKKIMESKRSGVELRL